MPCYVCSHCNKCGIFSMKMEFTCNTCGADVVPGESVCPTCDTPYAGNTTRGKMSKPEGSEDIYTELEKSEGLDPHRSFEIGERAS